MSIPADQIEQFTGRPPAVPPQPQPMPAGAVAQVAPGMPVVPAAPAPQAAPAAAPYNMTQYGQDLARRTLPAAYRPYDVPKFDSSVSSGAGTGGAGTSATPNATPTYPEAVALLEQRKGGKLDEAELYGLMERYRENVVRLGNLQAGHKQFVVDGAIEAFGVNAEEFNRRYLLQQDPAAAGGDGVLADARGQLAGAVGAISKGGLKAVQFLDDLGTGVRTSLTRSTAAVIDALAPYSDIAKMQQERIAAAEAAELRRSGRSIFDSGIVSDIAQVGIEAIDKNVASARSAGQIALDEAQAAKFDALRKDPNTTALDYVEAFLTSGNVVRGGLVPVLGEMVAPGAALRNARVAITALPKLAQVGIAATALGGPAAAGSVEQWKSDTMALPLSEFGPQVQEAHKELLEAGVPGPQAEIAAKQTAINQSLPYVTMGAYAANVGLATLPGLRGTEAAVAGLATRAAGKKALAKTVGRGAAEEGTEETAAGAVEGVSENIAENQRTETDRPLSRGLTERMAIGGTLGALVGGSIAATTPTKKPDPLRALPAPDGTPDRGVVPIDPTTGAPIAPAATGTAAPAAAAAAAAATPAAAAADVFGNGPGVEASVADAVSLKAADAIKAWLVSKTNKEKAKKYTAERVVDEAIDLARTTAGDSWAGMTAIQKVDAVEAVVTALKAVNKADTTALTTALRDRANQTMTPPTATVTATPLPADIAGTGTPATTPAPTATATAPTPAPKTKGRKPLGTPATTAPAPAAATPAPATTPTNKMWADMSGPERLTAVQGALVAYNAANPQVPLTIGRVQNGINNMPDAAINGMTAAQIAANLSRIAAAQPPAPKPAVEAPAATPADTATGKAISKAEDKADKAKPKRGGKKLAGKPPADTPADTATGKAIAKAEDKAADEAAKRAETTKPLKETTVDAVRRIVTGKPVEVTSEIVDAVNVSKKAKTADAIDAAIAKHKLPKAQAEAVRALAGIKAETKPLAKKTAAPPPPEKKPVPSPPAKKGGKKLSKPTTADAKLPDDLSKSRMAYRSVPDIAFESDVDKAIYTVSAPLPADATDAKKASREKFKAWLDGLGITAEQIRARGKDIRDQLKMDFVEGVTTLKVPKTGKTPSPKPNAPAGAGAAVTTAPNVPAPTPAEANALPAPTPPASEDYVAATKRILGDSVTDAQRVDIIRAVRRSRNDGTLDKLNEELESVKDDLTADQIRDLKALVTPQANRAPTVEGTVPEPVIDPNEPVSEFEVEQDVPELRIAIEDAMRNVPPGSVRGLRAKAMLEAVAKSPYSTKHQKWLAQKLAPIVASLQVSARLASINSRTGYHGTYDPKPNKVTIFTARPSTILHEMLHAVTVHAIRGLLPNSGNIKNRWEALHRHAYTEYKKYISKSSNTLTSDEQTTLANALVNPRELLTYALTNKGARPVLSKLPASSPKTNNLWEEFKNILTDFYAKYLSTTLPQRSLIDEILELAAETATFTEAYAKESPSNTLIKAWADFENGITYPENRIDYEKAGPSNPPAKKVKTSLTPVGAAQVLWEKFAFASIGIERAMQDVVRNGGKILAEYNPYYAFRKFTADMAEMKSSDTLEVVEPLKNWIAANWRSFNAGSPAEFRKNLDKFQQAYHELHERNPTVWAETVELPLSAEIERDNLIKDAYDGKIDGPTLNSKLISLASRSAKVKLDAWTDQTRYAKSNAALRKTLTELKKKGFDQNTLAEFNKYVQAVRDKARARQYQSGIVSQTDPFAHRGWEWYVPLKGHLNTSETMADYDIGSTRGSTKVLRKAKLNTLEGRQSTADNALSQLIEDMYTAATDAAKGDFTSKLFEFAILNKKNKEILGAVYTKYYGTPKSGYYAMVKKVDKKTGKVTYVPGRTHPTLEGRIGSKSGGFIHHDGNEHYVVYLPKEGQLFRGLSGMDRILTPGKIPEPFGKVVRTVGAGTTILARAYTTWHPLWQLMVGFLRDTSTLPTTVAMTVFDSPTQATGFAGQYLKNLAANTAQLHDLPRVWQSVRGNKAELKKYIDQNPNSLVAKIYAYRQAGGSTEFEIGLTQKTADEYLFDNLEPTALGKVKEGYAQWNEATSNWAALLENVGRVAAWDALKAQGMSPEEAAAITKSALDYGQSGEWGKLINAAHAFYRVSATSADVMRRAFTTKTGEIDVPKLAKWSGTFMAMGAIAYVLMGMMLGDDEEGKPRISKIDAKTLTQRILFPVPGGKTWSYPIGLGLPQIMLAPGILGAAVTTGHISAEEATEAYYDVLKRNAPISPMGQKKGTGPLGAASAWARGMVSPTLIRPVYEVDSNTNAFGNTVHTEWVDKNKYKSDQGMPSTGQEWKDIAKFLRDPAGIGLGVDMYPEDWAQLTRGYGGQVATEIVRWTIDKERKELEGVESSAVRTALRTAVTDEEFYYRNEARAVKDELTVSLRELNNAKQEDISESAWLSRNPQHRARINELKILDKAQDTYYEDIAKIRANRLLSTEGRRLQKKRADSRLRQAVERAQRVVERTAK